MKTLFLFTVSLFAVHTSVCGQGISMEETIKYINKKLGKSCTVSVESGIITAQYYNESKTLYRQDKASFKELDPEGIRYDEKDKILYIPCRLGFDECIDRELFINNIRRGYSRLSFPYDAEQKSIDGMINAFTHAIKLVKERKYKNTIVSFE